MLNESEVIHRNTNSNEYDIKPNYCESTSDLKKKMKLIKQDESIKNNLNMN